MTKRLTNLERCELMTPEEREEYQKMKVLVNIMQPEPTLEDELAALAALLKIPERNK
jgi:TnpA family transposase